MIRSGSASPGGFTDMLSRRLLLFAAVLGLLAPSTGSAALPPLRADHFVGDRYTYRLGFDALGDPARFANDTLSRADVVVASDGAGSAERRYVVPLAGRTRVGFVYKFDFSLSGRRPRSLAVTDYLLLDNAATGRSTTISTEWSPDGDTWWPVRSRSASGVTVSSGPGVTTIDFAARGRLPRVVYYRVNYSSDSGFVGATQQWARSGPGATAFVADFTLVDDPGETVAVGFNDYPNSYGDYVEFCERYIASGAKWIRISPSWASLQPSRDQWSATQLQRLDYITERFDQAGVRILWILAYTAPWASSQPSASSPEHYPPADWADWENYVSTLVARYGDTVRHWEIWNEPDHPNFWKGSIDELVTLVRRAHARIKQADPALTVLMPGLAVFDGSVENTFEPGTFLDRYLAAGGGAYCDVVNYHAYSASDIERRKYAGLIKLLQTHGLADLPIWITEAGHSTRDDASAEGHKADHLDQFHRLVVDWMPKVSHVFIYTFRKINPAQVGTTLGNYGLVEAGSMAATRSYHHYRAHEGATTDFATQAAQPAYAADYLPLYHVPATSGDGSGITASGDDRLVPAGRYLYLRVNDHWLARKNDGLDPRIVLEVTYLDQGNSYWRIDYDGDSSAYSPLPIPRGNSGQWKTRVFIVDDARFDNRQNNAADLRLGAGADSLLVRRVVVRKEPRVARILLQATNRMKFMEQVTPSSSSHEAWTTPDTKGGVSCRTISANNRHFCFRVSDALARGDETSVRVSITFWDQGSDTLALHYNAEGNAYKSVSIPKTGTGVWRTVLLDLPDARLANAQNSAADFRIANGGDGSAESVSRVEVAVGADGFAAWADLRGLPPAERSAAADSDDDGAANLLEYALGGDPLSADAEVFLPRPELVLMPDGARHLSFRASLPAAAAGVTLSAEVSADLVEWFSGPEHATDLADSEGLLHVLDNFPLSAASPRRFMRLVATE